MGFLVLWSRQLMSVDTDVAPDCPFSNFFSNGLTHSTGPATTTSAWKDNLSWVFALNCFRFLVGSAAPGVLVTRSHHPLVVSCSHLLLGQKSQTLPRCLQKANYHIPHMLQWVFLHSFAPYEVWHFPETCWLWKSVQQAVEKLSISRAVFRCSSGDKLDSSADM